MSKDQSIPRLKRQMGFVSILACVALVVFDVSVFNSSLPFIAEKLNIGSAGAVWVINSYQIAMLLTLIVFSAISEKIGCKNVLILGLTIFIVATIGCIISDSLIELVLARGLQGVGASALTSINLVMIRRYYSPDRAAQGFGISALVAALSMAAGPLLTSIILAYWRWQYLFLITLPILFSALTLAIWALPRWSSSQKKPSAMWKLASISSFARAGIVSIIAYVGQGMIFTVLPFFIYKDLCKSLGELGVMMMIWSIMVAVAAPVAGRFHEDIYPLLLRLGLCLMCFGQGLIIFMPGDAKSFDLAWRIALGGVGFGVFQAPNICILLNCVPEDMMSGASGVIATSRLAGQLIGSLLVSFIFFVFGEGCAEVAIGISSLLAMSACILDVFFDKKFCLLSR